MKARALLAGLGQPANVTEIMFRNALLEVDRLEGELDDLKETILYYRKIFDALKENASYHSDDKYKDAVHFGWIYEDEWVFPELVDMFDLRKEEKTI